MLARARFHSVLKSFVLKMNRHIHSSRTVTDTNIAVYYPNRIVNEDHKHDRLALVVLNQDLNHTQARFDKHWKKALLKILVDGGANHVYDTFIIKSDSFVPDFVTGDFDSIRPEVKEYYDKQGSRILETPDQNKTDFQKALRLVFDESVNNNQYANINGVLALTDFDGSRFDHVLANIDALYYAQEWNKKIPVYLLTRKNISWLLPPGKSSIVMAKSMLNSSCGLIPVGQAANHVTTTGLKWNLSDSKLKFGLIISACNIIESEMISVVTDVPLLWTQDIL